MHGRIAQCRSFIQHGRTSVLDHCKNVAMLSLALSSELELSVDRVALVRGALLHDYFLYDWHEGGLRFHGFTHPYSALKNALQDYSLNETEKDIIVRHMFPLTPIPPVTKEGWIVCIADKICTVWEFFNR